MESFSTTMTAPSGKITLFVRVWKKWGTAYKELDVNLDAISLVGKPTKGVVVIPPVSKPPVVVVPGDKTPPVVVVPPVEKPVVTPLTCGGTNLTQWRLRGRFRQWCGQGLDLVPQWRCGSLWVL